MTDYCAALCHVACMNNSSECLHILFQHGAQPTQSNSSALLPLHVAAAQDSVDCVQLITRRFPHVKKLRGGRQQSTALQIAQAIGAAPQIMQCLADRDDGSVESDVCVSLFPRCIYVTLWSGTQALCCKTAATASHPG